MCEFIAVAVLGTLQGSTPVDRSTGLQLTPSDSRPIGNSVGRGWHVWFLTERRLGCACRLYVPPDAEPSWAGADAAQARKTCQLRKKYTRLGWSVAKIDRALADSQSAQDRESAQLRQVDEAEEGDPSGMKPSAREVIAGLAKDHGVARFIVHEFSRDTATEKFEMSDGPRVAARAFLAYTEPILPDTWYTVESSGGHAV